MEIDSIHFYVIDATKIRDFAIDRLGLQALDNSVPIDKNTLVYTIGNSQLSLIISSPLNSFSPVNEYLKLHPSGVKDVSFRVASLDNIRSKIEGAGIKILAKSLDSDDLQWLKIAGWGPIEHTIVQSRSSSIDRHIDRQDPIVGIDHIVLNVAAGELESATNWYKDLFDFQVRQTFDIHTSTSGLTSKALVSAGGKIQFNINQPSSNNSQIQEFLDFNKGAGIQHIALQTNDIFTAIDRMRQQQVAFLNIPNTYYTNLDLRIGAETQQLLTNQEREQLERLQISIDWDRSQPSALLLQIFTEPIFEVPTFFFEIIERRNGAAGFGQGNFQALFEAIEQYNQGKMFDRSAQKV
jgi:4-hydroxyphenylpyruvate dioxygenase